MATPRSRGGNLGTRGHDASTYLFLFEDEGALSNIRNLILELECLFHMHVLVCARMHEFRGRNSIKGGRM